jgi:hypothetical protein
LQGRQDEGRGMEMTDIDPEIKAIVEKAMEYLRKHLNEAELREYERYYEEYKQERVARFRYDIAYKILRRFVVKMPHKDEEAFWDALRFLGGDEFRLLSIHIDYVYDPRRDAVIRRAEEPKDIEIITFDATILKGPESISQAYEAVAQDIRDIVRHISERVERLSQLTDEFLKTLEERELATRYPQAFEREEPREEKSGDEEVG